MLQTVVISLAAVAAVAIVSLFLYAAHQADKTPKDGLTLPKPADAA